MKYRHNKYLDEFVDLDGYLCDLGELTLTPRDLDHPPTPEVREFRSFVKDMVAEQERLVPKKPRTRATA